jgi:selenocysteine-specific elongation factor
MEAPSFPENSHTSGPRTVVIGTAGHIDHGKTALIRALTGVDTDRLPEEKQRGITIDLGFASLNLQSDHQIIQISFIDVPGHARFVRNMLAGAGSIDAVLLVISAEEGVKPQTEEHIAICGLLGIQCGLTVLTKIDAVDRTRLNEIRSAVEKFVNSSFLGSQPLVFVSARTGAGLDELRRELFALARSIPPRNLGFVTRLPLDRAFTVKGFGTVATGTLIAGSVTASEELAIEPGGRTVKVRGLQVHGHAAPAAHAATRVALNLVRIEPSSIHRGDTLVDPGALTAVDAIDVEIILLPNAPALKHRARVHFHAFASECIAAVSLFDSGSLEPGASGLAHLRISRPVVLIPGDRFVLRQGSPIATVGGGCVLDAHPLPRVKRRIAHEWLRAFCNGSPAAQLEIRIQRRGNNGISLSALVAETGLMPDAIGALLAPALKSQSVIALQSDVVASADALRDACDLVGREFESLLREGAASGVKRSALMSRLGLQQEVFDYVLQFLAEQGKLRIAGELLAAAADVPIESREQEKLVAICCAYDEAGLAPPTIGEVAGLLKMDPAELRRLITILLREKKLVRLGDDSLLAHPGALSTLKQTLQPFRGQTIDVPFFKRLTGLSRKYAIPLLEYLDRERITRKQGDRRLVL